MARYFEFKDEKSNKFWKVRSSGKKMIVRYGKIVVIGQTFVAGGEGGDHLKFGKQILMPALP